MSFVNWAVDGLHHWCVYLQIANDTGWLSAQFERMPYIMQNVHARLVTWLSDEKETK